MLKMVLVLVLKIMIGERNLINLTREKIDMILYLKEPRKWRKKLKESNK